jgi:hypothetical protein
VSIQRVPPGPAHRRRLYRGYSLYSEYTESTSGPCTQAQALYRVLSIYRVYREYLRALHTGAGSIEGTLYIESIQRVPPGPAHRRRLYRGYSLDREYTEKVPSTETEGGGYSLPPPAPLLPRSSPLVSLPPFLSFYSPPSLSLSLYIYLYLSIYLPLSLSHLAPPPLSLQAAGRGGPAGPRLGVPGLGVLRGEGKGVAGT